MQTNGKETFREKIILVFDERTASGGWLNRLYSIQILRGKRTLRKVERLRRMRHLMHKDIGQGTYLDRFFCV